MNCTVLLTEDKTMTDKNIKLNDEELENVTGGGIPPLLPPDELAPSSYSSHSDNSFSPSEPTDAGKYVIQIAIDEGENYNG